MWLVDWLADATQLTPHGCCLLWEPALLVAYAGSDLVAALAYFSIPLALVMFACKRRDVHHRSILVLFGLFILACGAEHTMSVVTLWVPLYHAEAVAKVVTAVLSLTTAIVLWPLLPKLVAAPSIDDLQAANHRFGQTIAAQNATAALLLKSQEELTAARDLLDEKVRERTAELLRANDIVRRNETRFRIVVEAVPNAILMTNARGCIEMVNSQAEATFGYDRAELLGAAIEILVPHRFMAQHPTLRDGLVGDDKRRMGADRIVHARRKDGSEFQVEIGLSPIDTENGRMVIASVVDVSERIKLEAQLRQAQKMEAMGVITAGVAHDFNNLLQALSGSLELIGDVIADRADLQPYVDIARRATTRGHELTHRLLSFSRQQILRPQSLALRDLLRETEALILNLFKETGATVSLTVDADDLWVMVDAGELSAALINLAVNARDAMTFGGQLQIRASKQPAAAALTLPDPHYAVISVIDNGCGMPAETLSRALDPFFTTKGVKGSGLGLSMVQGFARQSGGELQIESKPGSGTKIDIWLPLSAVDAPATDLKVELVNNPASRRVLVVDDAPDVLVTVDAFLRSGGMTVVKAESADLGLALLMAGRRFDVLISDFAMPGLNGADFVAQAREFQPGLPALIITGFQSTTALEGIGNITVLQKPFGRGDLLRAVNAICDADPLRREGGVLIGS